MEKLIILDYTNAAVDIYNVDSEADVDETYLNNLGYSPDCCSWMICEDMEITYHKGILK